MLRKMCKLILHEYAKILHTHAKWSKKLFDALVVPLNFAWLCENESLCEVAEAHVK